LRFEDDPEEIILELIYRYADKEIRPKVGFKDTMLTFEQCLGQTDVKSIKLEVMPISCHRRLPRRQTTERSKDTLKDSDLRSIYRELGYEEWGSSDDSRISLFRHLKTEETWYLYLQYVYSISCYFLC
jgi:hypothetical protein